MDETTDINRELMLDANATAGVVIGSSTASQAVDIRHDATTTSRTNNSGQVLLILNTVSNLGGPTTLTLAGSGETRLQGVVFDSTGALGITKLGSGTLRLGAATLTAALAGAARPRGVRHTAPAPALLYRLDARHARR